MSCMTAVDVNPAKTSRTGSELSRTNRTGFAPSRFFLDFQRRWPDR
jgi:hypothetical protein